MAAAAATLQNMIGLKVNNVFLDIASDKNSSAEIQRNSPFFAIDQISAEYSTPVTIPFTEKNAQALGYTFQYYTIREKKKVEAELFSDGISKGMCTLVIETAAMNYNNAERTTLSGYVLCGVSHFFQVIKDKKLTALSLGGARHFEFTTNAPDDGSAGYWQHFHATWTDNTIPYVFQPVRNEKYYGENSETDWMNQLGEDLKLKFDPKNVLVPMIRLKYLLEQIFIEHGFTVDFSPLQNELWKSIILIGTKKIDWTSVRAATNANGTITIQAAAKDNITISLAKHLAPDKTISDFIIQLFYRFGWAPVFDGTLCKIVPVKFLKDGQRKDWTPFASPVFSSSFTEDAPVYAFDTEIDSNDTFPSEPDLKDKKIGKPVATASLLPVPTVSEEGLIRFCFYENQWQQVQLDDTTNTYKWFVYGDNIYNYEPPGNTQTISSTIAAVPHYLTLHRTAGGPNGTKYYGYYPFIQEDSSLPFGYRMAFYHGLRKEQLQNGFDGTLFYPNCTSVYDATEAIEEGGDCWANVLKYTWDGGTIYSFDLGIIEFWWKPFLDYTARGEEIQFDIRLPLHDLIAYKWNDVILISNIAWLVKSYIEPLPYQGTIQATLKRLLPPLPPVVVTPVIAAGATIYAKLILINERTKRVDDYVVTTVDVVVELYTDTAGTLPYNPAETLYVAAEKLYTYPSGGIEGNITSAYYPVNDAVTTIVEGVQVNWIYNGTRVAWIVYSLDPAGAIGYSII